ncbi:hypothetical protein HanRHA438_Chr16g0773331 [Helianthus annuus]|nr:hypothetical protein HanRHA438_Chr16g0773331 [Helianthus annuus]
MVSQSPIPLHLCFFLIILFMFLSLSWYSSYESMFVGFFDSVRLIFIVSPVLLLVVLQLISTFDATGRSTFFVADNDLKAGSTPWGVGLVLVLLLFLLSYQSDLMGTMGFRS